MDQHTIHPSSRENERGTYLFFNIVLSQGAIKLRARYRHTIDHLGHARGQKTG